jgi:hypothetical protein
MNVHRIPHLANRDDREAPLSSGTGRREVLKMICPTGRAKYFSIEEWTVESALIGLAKIVFRAMLRAIPHRVKEAANVSLCDL